MFHQPVCHTYAPLIVYRQLKQGLLGVIVITTGQVLLAKQNFILKEKAAWTSLLLLEKTVPLNVNSREEIRELLCRENKEYTKLQPQLFFPD